MLNIRHLEEHFSHEIRKVFKNKFLTVVLILVAYFAFASWHFGLKDGFVIMLLTWSFFVLATPIPDGGIVLDLPLRYFLGFKMIHSEIFVWAFAILLNITNLLFNPEAYEKTFLLTIFKDILITPIPYYLIIVLSGVGTFFTLYIGDEVYDLLNFKSSVRHNSHKRKRDIIILISTIVFVLILYELLLTHLGVKFI
ncbi:hypothetical protein H6504_05020 [Candidatus Woesearchaeota archaeon]|nr:hypothetical protein [Candidatus Woesearchaeota archaeon]